MKTAQNVCIFHDKLLFFLQPKQRTSIVSSLEFHRMNHSHNYFEINSSIGCTSFISTPAISPANYSFGSLEHSVEEREVPGIENKAYLAYQQSYIKLQVCGFKLELLLYLVVKHIYQNHTKLFLISFFCCSTKGSGIS